MRRCWAVFAVVVSGCTGDPRCDPGPNPYGDPLNNRCIAVDVLGGDSAGFDTLELFMSTSIRERDRPVVTPALIAAGRSAPSLFEVIARTWPDKPYVFAGRIAEFSHEEWSPVVPWGTTVAAVGLRDRAIVGANVASAEQKVNGADIRYLNGVVELSAVVEAELWGRAGSVLLKHRCARIVVGAVTTYFVRALDRDCDGVENQSDCNPDVYCDPDQGACSCP